MKNSTYYLELNGKYIILDLYTMNSIAIDKTKVVDRQYMVKVLNKIKNDDSYILKYTPLEEKDRISPVIVTGFDCNYSCSYCYQKEKKTIMGKLHPDDIDKIKEFYKQYAKIYPIDIDFDSVSIIGGEPLLLDNKSVLDKISASFPNSGFVITTNGVYIRQYSDFILRNKTRNLLFKISLDGTKEAHFKYRKCADLMAYEKTLNGIKFLIENNIRVIILSVFNPDAIDSYTDYFDQMEALGWGKNGLLSLAFIPEVGCGSDDINNDYLLKCLNAFHKLKILDHRASKVDARKLVPGSINLLEAFKFAEQGGYTPYRCSVLNMPNFSFLPDGTVRTCLLMPDDSGIIGRYKPNIEIDIDKINKLKKRRIDMLEKCRKCALSMLCKGGCAATEAKYKGSMDKGYCELWKSPDFLDFLEDVL